MRTIDYRTDLKIRKPHRCDLCEQMIPAGEVCHRGTWRDGGEFIVSFRHAECVAATEHAKWDDMDWEMFCDPIAFREVTLAAYRAAKGGA